MNNLNYTVIGNCKSAALISEKGSIDWCCLPNFDSSSVFAKLLDKKIGGSFEIIVDKKYIITQAYDKNTNIVETVFTKGKDQFKVIDFMPRYKLHSGEFFTPPDIIRYFQYISGKPKFSILYDPKLEYAKHDTLNVLDDGYITSYTVAGGYDSIYLYTDIDKASILNKKKIELTQDVFILLSYNQKLARQTLERQYIKLHKTKAYWLDWTFHMPFFSTYEKEINRSALILKLLSYEKTGAVLAAITTSLPESIGEERNWDYRFCWIRDASMVTKVMSKLGQYTTVRHFMKFIIEIIPDKDDKIQIMYGINREKKLKEETLDHLSGYENSKPVRIGNAAYIQKQHDIFGILMDVIYHQSTNFSLSLEDRESLWTIVRGMTRVVFKNWQTPDKGIWEMRSEDKHFTFSKVLCWVALDRAAKIAKNTKKEKYVREWRQLANSIKKNVLKNSWNKEIKAFTQYYGSDSVDASVLLMAPYGFIKPKDPQYISTVKVIEKELCADGLMYRYKNKDDFGVPSSSFTICTFWMINALKAIGEDKKAKKMFDKLLSYSNHVGLFSEDIDFKSKRLLGNFPQAYSHLALIETAIDLSDTSPNKKHNII